MAVLALALGSLAGVAVAKQTGNRAQGSAGEIDKSFGQDGKTAVSTPPVKFPESEPLKMATAPSGKSYVLDGSLLLAFGADGRPDRGFGQNGRVQVATATGVSSAADLAVDDEGRILVTGSFEPTPGAINRAVPQGVAFRNEERFSDAFVIRYLPNGQRDTTFGSGGEADANLEVPASVQGVGVYFEKPGITVTQIALVEGDQPVIGGTYVYADQYCYFTGVAAYAFVARIGTAGTGTQTIPTTAWTNVPSERVSALVPTPSGGLAALSQDGVGCELRGSAQSNTASVLSPGPVLAAGLDPNRPQIPNLQSTIAVDGQGRMLVAEGPEGIDFTGENHPWKLIRLLPNGDFDTSFGSNGGMRLLGFGEESVRSIVVDDKGRALVGGGDHRFRIVRVGTTAKIDHSFGDHGWTETGFGSGTSAELQAMTIDQKGRVVVAGRVHRKSLKTGEGVGLVRFLPGK
jgi:uncharacterized delta-60 repeat protein